MPGVYITAYGLRVKRSQAGATIASTSCGLAIAVSARRVRRRAPAGAVERARRPAPPARPPFAKDRR